MINALKSIFKGKGTNSPKEYEGLSDFFLHATDSEKKKVITEAARKANEDQLKIFREATLKTES